jgi:hypothetical protein
MEVHQHPPQPSGKPFKEYFYEFFMLFLAVTAGFGRRTSGRSPVERHKEHEYMQSLVVDLQQDLLGLNSAIAELKPFRAGWILWLMRATTQKYERQHPELLTT